MPEIQALNDAQGALGAIYETCMNLFKIVFGFAQVVSTLTVNLPTVPWPDAVVSAWDSMGVVNFDVLGGSLSPTTYLTHLSDMYLTPI